MFGLFKSRKVKQLEEKIERLRMVNSDLLSLIDGNDCVIDKNINNAKELIDYIEKSKKEDEEKRIHEEFLERTKKDRVCKDCGCDFNTESRWLMDHRHETLIRDICCICEENYYSKFETTPSGPVLVLKKFKGVK